MKIYNFFNNLSKCFNCHQIPERSFKRKGKQFPFCSRCSGVLLGQMIMIVLIIFGINFSLLISLILLGIMFLDWFVQYLSKKDFGNLDRFITGILGGLGWINLLWLGVVWIWNFL